MGNHHPRPIRQPLHNSEGVNTTLDDKLDDCTGAVDDLASCSDASERTFRTLESETHSRTSCHYASISFQAVDLHSAGQSGKEEKGWMTGFLSRTNFPAPVIIPHQQQLSMAAPILDYRQSNFLDNDTRKIQQDIDDMFSYLNGWLDDGDDSLSESTDPLSPLSLSSPPEAELDSQSDDSAVAVDDHQQWPCTSNDESSDGDKRNQKCNAAKDTEMQLQMAMDAFTRGQTAVVQNLPVNSMRAPTNYLLNPREPNYIQLDFPTMPNTNRDGESNSASVRHSSDSSSSSGNESLKTSETGDSFRVLYSRIVKEKSSSYVISNPEKPVFSVENCDRRSFQSPILEHPKNAITKWQEDSTFRSSPEVDDDELPYSEPQNNQLNCGKMSEGSLVHSLYPLSSAMPGTLSFMSGETGVLMRTNIGGWCYICMRDKEGWAPADYWQPLRSALRERTRARGIAERNSFLDDWFLGPINRPDSEFLLLQFGQEGDFFIRNSSMRSGEFTLTMRHKSVTHHFAIKKIPGTGKFTIGNVAFHFNSLTSIVVHYRQHTILSDTFAILKQPFCIQM